MKTPLFLQKLYIELLKLMLRPRLMPAIVEKLEHEARMKRHKELDNEMHRPLEEEDVAARYRGEFINIRVPVRFRRVTGGRRPTIELVVTEQIMQRLVDVNFERAMSGKTVDVMFKIPKDLVSTDGKPEGDAAVAPPAAAAA